MSLVSKILYPTDFSQHSQAAIPLALDLAKRYEAELHCLHAVDLQHEFFMEGGYVIPLQTEPIDWQRTHKAALEHMNEFVNRHMPERSDPVKQVIAEGKPFEQIIRYARQEKIDLIVIGTHGHSALASMLIGSVAEKVVRKAPCAVLIVRHPGHEFKSP